MMPTKRLIYAAICFALCWGCSIAVGFAFFGDAIFQRNLTLFQFVATGAVSAFAAAVIWMRVPRWALLAFVAGFIFVALSAGSSSAARLFRDAVLVLAIVAAVSVGTRLDRWFPRVPVGKFVLWAAVFGALHVVAVLCIALVLGQVVGLEAIVPAARIGTLVGVGVGIGYEIAALIVVRSGSPSPSLARS
jgi:hypothetical protein